LFAIANVDSLLAKKKTKKMYLKNILKTRDQIQSREVTTPKALELAETWEVTSQPAYK
jgi:hypothetical protein